MENSYKYINTKISAAYYALRTLKQIVSQDILIMIIIPIFIHL